MGISSLCLILFTLLLTLTGQAASAQSGPTSLNVSGELRASGTNDPITNASVNFRLEIWDKSDACLIYSELHVGENLNASGGRFSLLVGEGTSKQNRLAGSTALTSAVFTNPGVVAPFTGCAAGLTLNSGDSRNLHVSYDLGAGYVAMTPSVPIVGAAYASVAETLEGRHAADFIQVNGTGALNQVNTEYAFSLSNWPKLKALLDGTSSQYLPTTPTVPLDVNGQKIIDLADPTNAQDAVTKHYADSNLGGFGLDPTGVGPTMGAGSTLVWDQVADKWKVGTVSSAPTGVAGGDLTGTYPNPTIKNNAITTAKIQSTGVAINRLVITDPSTGAGLGLGECLIVGQVYAWTTNGWMCTSVSTLAPVTSVAGKTGVVTLNPNDVVGLGSAALFDWGTAANQVVRLDASARLPAVDASQLVNVNATLLASRSVASTAPTVGQVLGWNAVSNAWEPTSVATSGGTVTSIATGTGLLGGVLTSVGTLSVDVGNAALKVVQENASAQIAQLAGSAASPSFTFGGNLNTGLYSPGANQLALATNGTAALNVNAAGNVGIGVASPAYRLHLASNAGSSSLRIDGAPSPMNGLYLGTTYDSAYISNGLDGNGAGWTAYPLGTSMMRMNNGEIHLYTDFTASGPRTPTDRLMISQTGQIGIGTIAPQAALDIAITGTSSAILLPRDVVGNRPTGVNGMLRYNTSSNAFEGFANNTWATIASGSSAGTLTSIASGTGLLGGPILTVGTFSVDVGASANKIVQENANAQIAQAIGSPSAPSYSFVGNTNTGVYSPGTNQLAFATSGVAALNITAGNAVGVGTASPASELEVTGTSAAPVVRVTKTGYGAQVRANFNNDKEFELVTVWNNSVVMQATAQARVTSFPNKVAVGAVGTWASPFAAQLYVNGSVGIGTDAPQAGLDIALTGTAASAILIPRDVAGNRPTGVNGMLRYNTSSNAFEGFANNTWATIASGSSAGTLTSLATGTGLLGGIVTTVGTLSVDVGTAANKIVQENATAQIAQNAGAVALPSYSFAGNTNTGLYSPGVNQVALATNGTAAMTVAANSNVQFFGAIGVQKANPVVALDVHGYIYSDASFRSGNGSAAYTAYGFQSAFGSGMYHPGLQDLGFSTSGIQRVEIDALGSVGIGTATPKAALDITATGTSSAMIIPRDIAGNRPTGVNGMLRYNTSANVFEGYANNTWATIASGSSAGTLTSIASGTGLVGGAITTVGTFSVDVGASANKIVRENASAQIAQTFGSAATPSYSFATNETTGVYSPGANQLALTTSGSSALNVAATGFVGLGSSTPAVHLDLVDQYHGTNGNLRLTDNDGGTFSTAFPTPDLTLVNTYLANDVYTAIGMSNGGARSYLVSKRQNATSGSLSIYNDVAGTLTESLTINGANVGIGSAQPAAGLDIATTGTAGSAILIPRDIAGNRPTGVNGMLRYNTTSNTFEGFQAGGWMNLIAGGGSATFPLLASPGTTSAATPSYSFTGNANTGLYSPGTNQLALTANGTAALTILANGSVGIGTTTPVAKLDVNGAINISGQNAISFASGNTSIVIGPGASSSSAYNTVIGQNASAGYGALNTANTIVGNQAASSLGEGGANVALGYQALYNAVGANNNVALGSQALLAGSYNGVGNNNVAVGAQTLQATNGTSAGNNVAVGYQAGGDVTSGSKNILIGSYPTSGVSVTSGSGNLMIGYDVRPQARTGSNQMNIGNLIYATSLATGATAGKGQVGIGTGAPQAALDVTSVGTASAIIVPRDTTGNRPGGVNGMIRYNTDLSQIEGYVAGVWTSLGGAGGTTFPLLAPNGSATAPSYAFSAGATTGVFSPGVNQLALSVSGTAALNVVANGSVGVGTATPGATLDVNGGIRPGSSTVVSATCAATNEGTQRYNYTNHYMEFCNGTNWMQIPSQVAGSTANVTAIGSPASANVYSYTGGVTASYAPGYGAIANTYDRNWPSNGSANYRNSSCAELQASANYITYDLGSVKSIANLYYSFVTDLAIGVAFSTDGVSYTSGTTISFTGSGTKYGTVTLSPTVTARYIRVTNSNNQNNDYAGFCEFAVGP